MSIGNEYSVSDIERSIQSDMGVLVTIPDTPGSFIRFDVKKRGDKAGWCVYYVNEHCVVALYGSWISGQRYEWVNKEKKEITPEIRREVEESRKRRDEEIKAEQNRAAADASALYMALPEASDDFPYLLRKRVHNHDGILRYSEDSDCIVVPLINADGEIRSLERIFPDGQKRFYPGGEKKGNFCVIGDLGDKAFLCEGYATGVSLALATEKPVAVAFDAGNLEAVAEALRAKFPRVAITICADNDHATERDGKPWNPGVEKAKAAAQKVGGKVIVPAFSEAEKAQRLTDFNDLHKSQGLGAVKRQVARAQEQNMER